MYIILFINLQKDSIGGSIKGWIGEAGKQRSFNFLSPRAVATLSVLIF